MKPNDFWIIAPILLPLATAFILPILDHLWHHLRTLVCIASVFITLLLLIRMIEPVAQGSILVYWMSGWTPREGVAIGISIAIDAWGLLIALVVAVVGLMALIYSTVSMRHESGKDPFYVLVMLLITGLIGFALSGDLFNQFVWLEVFSVAAFALTGFRVDDRGAVEAAFKYLITNSVASFFIAVGLALMYMHSGALNLAQAAQAFDGSTDAWVAVGLLLGGYATKAALIPWHFWLPDAHTVAPSPVSAIFSGALVKIGVYAVARTALTIVPFEQGSWLQTTLLVLAAITMLVGGAQMLQQQSVKRVLAFSSVSQMGYIVAGIALGTPLGLAAAAMHVIHHALVKAALFMGAGAVQWRGGVHHLDEGGGILRKMPITFVLMLLAALGLSGMPLLSGFISKTLLEEAARDAHLDALSWVAVAASALTFAGMARLLWYLFGPRQAAKPPVETKEAPLRMLVPMAVLVAGSLLVGLFPASVNELLTQPASRALYEREHYINTVLAVEAVPEVTHEAGEHEEMPNALNVTHWGIPLLIAVAGSLIAYLVMHPPADSVVKRLVLLGGDGLRRWHSGLVTDYTLWNAFGTALMLILLLLGQRLG